MRDQSFVLNGDVSIGAGSVDAASKVTQGCFASSLSLQLE
jgi:hypothetical protein